MAVVERQERDVVVEFGVPGISVGVSGLEGGSGMLMRVGVDILVGYQVSGCMRSEGGDRMCCCISISDSGRE